MRSNVNVVLEQANNPIQFAEKFLKNTYTEPLDDWQRQFLASNALDLLLLIHGQCGKSTSAASKGLHYALTHENATVLNVSPSLRQSVEQGMRGRSQLSEFLLNFGVEVSKLGLRDLDVPEIDLPSDQKLGFELPNRSRMICLPGENPSAIRGYSRPDMIICDEADHIQDATYAEIRRMLPAARKIGKGFLILISTPRRIDGFFHDAYEQSDLRGGTTFRGWEHKACNVDWENHKILPPVCTRLSAEYLEQELHTQAETFFRAEYLCEWISEAGLFTLPELKAAVIVGETLDFDVEKQ